LHPKNFEFFFAQNMFFTDKKSKNVKKSNTIFSACHAPPPPPWTKICATPTAYTIKPRELKFWLPEIQILKGSQLREVF
jgi:hypothetical protein